VRTVFCLFFHSKKSPKASCVACRLILIRTNLLLAHPCCTRNIYRPQVIAQYSSAEQDAALDPHVFAIAENAYRCLFREGRNQSIIVSGESGAGKTVSAKFAMRYFASVGGATNMTQIEKKVLASNPVMEAIGNAKTTRNDNSSRFGKYIELQFSEEQVIVGATMRTYVPHPPRARAAFFFLHGFIWLLIFFLGDLYRNVPYSGAEGSILFYPRPTSQPELAFESVSLCAECCPLPFRYLLEKSRVVHQAENERNYHIFYQMCAQADSALLADLEISEPDDFFITKQGDAAVVPDVDDAEDFSATTDALRTLGLEEERVAELFRILAGLMHLGNVEVRTRSKRTDDAIIPEDDTHLPVAAGLLGVEPSELSKWATHRKIQTGKEVFTKPLTATDAGRAVHAFAKHIYAHVFDWIVAKVNASLAAPHKGGKPLKTIGVLDIYGFEVFKVNSFEQFCINYANEKLQQLFNRHVFKLEQEECVAPPCSVARPSIASRFRSTTRGVGFLVGWWSGGCALSACDGFTAGGVV
jgi:myosin heavy subunit